MLVKANKSLNLIGKSTINFIWNRQYLDSAQVIDYIEENTVEINTYEDMKNTYANMILADYYFVL